MKCRLMIIVLFLLFSFGPAASTVFSQGETTCESEYIVQVNDWLAKIATKHFGNPHEYPAIMRGTNAKSATDNSYPYIWNPDIILPGWKLCLPPTKPLTAHPQRFIDIVSAPDESGIINIQRILVQPDHEFVPRPVTSLLDLDGELPGIVRLALARPVSNFDNPERLENAAGGKWVLLAPTGDHQNAKIWQEIVRESAPDEPIGASVLMINERAIDEVIPFAQDTASPEASVSALFDALISRYNEDTNAGLWVDFVLFEGVDTEGMPEWILYVFTQPPPTGGEDRKVTYCCRWLGCYGNTTVCRFWGCAGICR